MAFMKINTQKKYAQKMWINLAFFKNPSIIAVFPTQSACFSVDLDWNISQMSLDSTVFSYSFFFGAEIDKLEILKNLPFAYISTYKIKLISAHKNKYTKKLVCLRYVVM